jgi:hypothetical protein
MTYSLMGFRFCERMLRQVAAQYRHQLRRFTERSRDFTTEFRSDAKFMKDGNAKSGSKLPHSERRPAGANRNNKSFLNKLFLMRPQGAFGVRQLAAAFADDKRFFTSCRRNGIRIFV